MSKLPDDFDKFDGNMFVDGTTLDQHQVSMERMLKIFFRQNGKSLEKYWNRCGPFVQDFSFFLKNRGYCVQPYVLVAKPKFYGLFPKVECFTSVFKKKYLEPTCALESWSYHAVVQYGHAVWDPWFEKVCYYEDYVERYLCCDVDVVWKKGTWKEVFG